MIADQVNYCPRCGTHLVTIEQFGKQRPTCPSCNWIFFPDPKVAVAVLVVNRGKVLLVKRANEPMRGHWTLPAGFMDAGEDPARAAERECYEETGLKVKVTQLLDVMAGKTHARGADILITYQAELLSGTLQAGDDADAVQFFEPVALPPLAFINTEVILESWQHGQNREV